MKLNHTNYTLEYDSLEPNTTYTAFIIGANNHPGYPFLMNESMILNLSFTTKEPPNQGNFKLLFNKFK